MTLSKVIADTRTAVTSDPAAGQVLFSADGTLTGITEVDVRTGTHTFTVDEPRALGGGGTAPNPVEYALASLGSCQAITYRFWAEHLGMTLDTLTVRVSVMTVLSVIVALLDGHPAKGRSQWRYPKWAGPVAAAGPGQLC